MNTIKKIISGNARHNVGGSKVVKESFKCWKAHHFKHADAKESFRRLCRPELECDVVALRDVLNPLFTGGSMMSADGMVGIASI